MTVKIDRGVVSEDDPKPTRANGQLIIENIIARAKESIGGAEDFATTKVLSSDILTIGNDHCVYEIGGEGGVADELKAINYDPSDAIRDGMVIGVFSLHVITFKNGVSVAKKIFTRMRRDTVLQDANTIIWFKYKLSADAWYQVFPDLSAQFDLLLGARPVSTLTIVSSQVTVTAALHLIDSGSAMDVDQMLHGTEFNGSNLIGICTANADYVRTMRHDQGTNGKLNLLGAASIPMAQGSWYFFERTVSGANTIWVHRFTIGGAVLAKSTAAGKIPIGDGLGGWIESGGTLAKGSIPVGTSGSAFGYLAVGANGTSPVADSAEATGIRWDTPSAGGSTRVNNYRLSVSSSDPEPGNTTGVSTIYLKEYNGDAVDIYNGSTWSTFTALSLSIAVPSTQYFRIYDVYLDYASGTPALAVTAWDSGGQSTKAITLLTIANPCVITCTAHGWNVGDKIGIRKGTAAGTAWSDTAMGLDQKEFYISAKTTNTLTLEGCDTSALAVTNYTGATAYLIPASRTTAIVRQNGTWCQSGTLTKRLLGTFKTNGAGTVDDSSALARNLSNVDNQRPCHVQAIEPAASWSSPNVTKMVARSGSLARGVTRFEYVLALPLTVEFTDTDVSANTSIASALSVNRVEEAVYPSMQNLVAYSTGGYGSAYPEGLTGVEHKAQAAGSYFVQKMAHGSSAVYNGDLFNNYAGAKAACQAKLWR